MSQGVIARRYAKALISLAEKGKELEKTGQHFSELAEARGTMGVMCFLKPFILR